MKQTLADKDFGWLEERIGYQFQNRQLLQQALTHRSVQGCAHNDRLEFLGDAVLGYVVAKQIYHRHQQAGPGRMSLLRMRLIRNITLVEIAEEIRLYQFISFNLEISENNRQKMLLADTMEALIAAVCLDGGIGEANSLVENLFASRLSSIDDTSEDQLKPPITLLQEHMLSQGHSVPRYTTQQIKNADATLSNFWVVSCAVTLPVVCCVVGYGASKKKAKHAAAQSALRVLEYHND